MNFKPNKDIEKGLEKVFSSQFESKKISVTIPCPYCSSVVEAVFGENKCPSCGKIFRAGTKPDGE